MNGRWVEVLSFRVNGDPKAQPRPVVTRKKNVFTPHTADGWKDRVRWTIHQTWHGTPIEGPVKVDVDFFFLRPKRLYRKSDPPSQVLHTARPDLDNLHKCILDCMTHLGVFKDDGQVCEGTLRKFYHAKEGHPGAFVKVSVWQPRTWIAEWVE